MTCIVGIAEGGTVVIGGDAMVVHEADWTSETLTGSKVFRRCGLLIGFEGSLRKGQMIEHHLAAPKPLPDTDPLTYMVRTLVPSLQECIETASRGEKGSAEDHEGAIVVGLLLDGRAYIYSVMQDFAVFEPRPNYTAIGSGANYALGSLYSSKSFGPKYRATIALEAAAEHNAGVRSPFHILSLPADED